eukprot:SM000121S25991  [mRNA]  locus=s121:140268:140474:- [translate_table: standard]
MAGGGPGDFFRARDEYRFHPMIRSPWRHAFPGLGLGVAAFAVYLFVEGMASKLAAPRGSSGGAKHGDH